MEKAQSRVTIYNKTKALMEVLTSDDIKEFIETKYDGAVVSLF